MMIGKYLLANQPRMAEAGGGSGGGAAGGGAGGGAAGAGGAGGAAGGGQQQQQAPWYASPDLGFEGETLEFFKGKNYPDSKTALSSLVHADRLARDRNVIPKPDPQKLRDWPHWADLGWVPDSSKYSLKPPGQLPKGLQYDGELTEHLRKVAHEERVPLGALQRLADEMLTFQGQRFSTLEASQMAEHQRLNGELDKTWGNDRKRNTEMARRAATALGLGAEDAEELNKVIGSPRLLKLFHGLGEKMAEMSLDLGPADGVTGLPSSIADLRGELAKLEGDKDFMAAFRDERHPQHDMRVNQRMQIIQAIAEAERTAAGGGGRKAA